MVSEVPGTTKRALPQQERSKGVGWTTKRLTQRSRKLRALPNCWRNRLRTANKLSSKVDNLPQSSERLRSTWSVFVVPGNSWHHSWLGVLFYFYSLTPCPDLLRATVADFWLACFA